MPMDWMGLKGLGSELGLAKDALHIYGAVAIQILSALLLRQAERVPGGGERTLYGASAVIERLSDNADWLQRLERHLGAPVRLREEAGLAIFGGHVHSQFQ